VEQVRSLLGQVGRQRMILMGGVALALLAALAFVATRGGDARMAFLYTDLDPTAAQSVADKLKSQNVPFQLSADGTAVLAPEDRLAELRMGMAGDKLGGKIGYEVLDEEEPFGVSASRAKLNETRAIEGELAKSIETLQNVGKARVHLVMPERALFARETTKASAAVTVRTKGRLADEAVQAIRSLIASSVPELSPESVSVVDQTGALLARAGDAGVSGGGAADERQAAVESRLRDEVEALLAPIVGQGKVRAEVSADIDRDHAQEETDTFDPDKQVIARQVSVGTKDQSSETEPAAQAASVGQQLPEARGAAGNRGPSKNEAHDETSEDTTYDNSKTHSVVVRAPGRIKRLTVAVMVDGGTKGLPPQQIQRLTRLVENAVGADAERGDSVVIEAMPFAAQDAGTEESGFLSSLPVDRLIGFAEVLAIAGVGLVALRMIRPRPAPEAADVAETRLNPLDPDAPALADGTEEGQPTLPGQPAIPALPGLNQEIALAQVDGRLRADALTQVGEAVAASPAEAAAVIRQWMNA